MAQSALDLRPKQLQVQFLEYGPTTDLNHVHYGDGERLSWSRIRRRSSLREYPRRSQAPKSDLMARGIAVDLLQVAKRVGPQCEAAEHKDLSGEEGFPLDSIVVDD